MRKFIFFITIIIFCQKTMAVGFKLNEVTYYSSLTHQSRPEKPDSDNTKIVQGVKLDSSLAKCIFSMPFNNFPSESLDSIWGVKSDFGLSFLPYNISFAFGDIHFQGIKYLTEHPASTSVNADFSATLPTYDSIPQSKNIYIGLNSRNHFLPDFRFYINEDSEWILYSSFRTEFLTISFSSQNSLSKPESYTSWFSKTVPTIEKYLNTTGCRISFYTPFIDTISCFYASQSPVNKFYPWFKNKTTFKYNNTALTFTFFYATEKAVSSSGKYIDTPFFFTINPIIRIKLWDIYCYPQVSYTLKQTNETFNHTGKIILKLSGTNFNTKSETELLWKENKIELKEKIELTFNFESLKNTTALTIDHSITSYVITLSDYIHPKKIFLSNIGTYTDFIVKEDKLKQVKLDIPIVFDWDFHYINVYAKIQMKYTFDINSGELRN